MYLVPAVFPAHQCRYLQYLRYQREGIKRRHARESSARTNIGFSCSRERARARAPFLFFTFRTSFKASQKFHLSLSFPPPPHPSLFLSCQAIMRDRNFPRARSGGNTRQVQGDNHRRTKCISPLAERYMGVFAAGFVIVSKAVDARGRTNSLLSRVSGSLDITKVSWQTFFRATRNKASVRDNVCYGFHPCISFF